MTPIHHYALSAMSCPKTVNDVCPTALGRRSRRATSVARPLARDADQGSRNKAASSRRTSERACVILTLRTFATGLRA